MGWFAHGFTIVAMLWAIIIAASFLRFRFILDIKRDLAKEPPFALIATIGGVSAILVLLGHLSFYVISFLLIVLSLAGVLGGIPYLALRKLGMLRVAK